MSRKTRAIDAGQRLDAISSRLSAYGRYSYALVDKVLDIGDNRSNMALGSDVSITRRLSGRIGFSWQRSHGGLRSTEFTDDLQVAQYDRLIRDNHFHMSGGMTVSLPKVDGFVSCVSYVSGSDTHDGQRVQRRHQLALREVDPRALRAARPRATRSVLHSSQTSTTSWRSIVLPI